MSRLAAAVPKSGSRLQTAQPLTAWTKILGLCLALFWMRHCCRELLYVDLALEHLVQSSAEKGRQMLLTLGNRLLSASPSLNESLAFRLWTAA